MKLIAHLIKKDIYRLRWDLTLWLAFIVMGAMLAIRRAELGIGWRLFWTIETLLTAVIAAQLVHVDTLVGSTAFWRTRPIPRASLLWSKVWLAALALMLYPAAGDSVAAVLEGLRWQDALSAGGSAFIAQAFVVVPLLAIAAVTGSLGAFVLVAIGAFGGFFVLQSTLAGYWTNYPPTYTLALMTSRMIALVVGVVVTSALVLPQQTLTLKTRYTVAVAVVLQVLLASTIAAWRWDFVTRQEPRVDPTVVRPDDVKMEFHPDFVRLGYPMGLLRSNTNREPEKIVSAGFSWSGVPNGIVTVPVSVRARFRGREGLDIRFDETRFLTSGPFPDKERSVTNRWLRARTDALGGVTWLNTAMVRSDAIMLHVLHLLERDIQGQHGELSVSVELDAARYEVVARTPLVTRGRYTADGQSEMVRRAFLEDYEDARAVFVYLDGAAIAARSLRGGRFGGSYIVTNAARGEALFTNEMPGTRQLSLRDYFVSAFPFRLNVTRRVLMARPDQTLAIPTHVDEAWLAGAELVRLEPVPLGRFTTSIRIDDFVLQGNTQP